MKTFFFLFIFGFCFLQGFSQDSRKSLGYIDYKFSHVNDTLNRMNPNVEIMRLYFNNSVSLFKNREWATFEGKLKESITTGSGVSVNLGRMPAGSKGQFFCYYNKGVTLKSTQLGRNNYLINDTTKPEWNILDDTMNILGYRCQLASCKLKGRWYNAWFTTDLVYSSGPWMLKGLPGMILKATDTKSEVIFEAVEIKMQSEAETIVLPLEAVTVSQNEYNTLADAFKKNPSAFRGDRNGESPITAVKIASGTGNPNNSKSKVYNNPIVLSEN